MDAKLQMTSDVIASLIAGDDQTAIVAAAELARDARFYPVNADGLWNARTFDRGGPAYIHPMTAPFMRAAPDMV